jgi:catechol 2,3-dioxygenase-like lactoylglutathione lyase family enzyme
MPLQATEATDMAAVGLNHVSINAVDLEESVEFYRSLFGLERIATYTFAFPSQYLGLGELQLHIFERPTTAPEFHHIAIDVDDFESVLVRASELRILEESTFFSACWVLPDGAVQLYLRDPAGNLVEVNCPDVSSLSPAVAERLPRLEASVEQSAEALTASLYSTRRTSDRLIGGRAETQAHPKES